MHWSTNGSTSEESFLSCSTQQRILRAANLNFHGILLWRALKDSAIHQCPVGLAGTKHRHSSAAVGIPRRGSTTPVSQGRSDVMGAKCKSSRRSWKLGARLGLYRLDGDLGINTAVGSANCSVGANKTQEAQRKPCTQMKMSKITCRSEVHKNTFGPNLTSLYTQCNWWHQEHFYCGFQTWFLSNSLSQWQQMWCWVQNPRTEGSQRLLLTAQLTQTHSLAVFKNKDHCSAQQNNPIKMAAQCCAAVTTGVPVKLHQLKCWEVLFPWPAHCAPELPVKLCCFCWDAVCALLGLLVVPALTFNFPVIWTAQTHCCHCMYSLILLSSHSAPFHSWDLSMLYLEISSCLGKKGCGNWLFQRYKLLLGCACWFVWDNWPWKSLRTSPPWCSCNASVPGHPYSWGLPPWPRELPE